jgi:hypothetical protein
MKRLIISLSLIICHFSFVSVAAQSGYGTGGGFDPENPAIPGANGLYLDKGIVVIDGLRSGNYDDVGEAIYHLWQRYCDEQGYGEYSSERSSDHMLEVFDRIRTVIVCADLSRSGEEQGAIGISQDIGSYFRKMATLDLSHTTGWTIDYSISDSESLQYLEVLVLPDCVQEVVPMKDLPRLTDVYCYAELPPTLRQYSEWYTQPLFAENSEVKVHVPTGSMALYKGHKDWGKYNIVDIESSTGKLEVKMPQGVDLQQYRNMWLTLTDEATQTQVRYVVTDRQAYFFAGISGDKDVTYTAALVNRLGSVVCQQTGIKPTAGTTQVQLKNPLKVTDVQVRLMSSDGLYFGSEGVTITWYDAEGQRLTSSPSLAGLVKGDEVQADIKLSPYLLESNAQPERQRITIDSDISNTKEVTVQLQYPRTHAIIGFVRDADTGQPLHEVSVTTIVSGSASSGSTSLTYSDGRFISPRIREGHVKISLASKEYLRRDLEFDIYPSTPDQYLVGDFYLKRVSGKTVSLDFKETYAGEGQQGNTYPFFQNYEDLIVSVYNESQGGVRLSNVSVQFPQVVVLSGADDGDELRLDFSSVSGAFDPFSVTAVIEDDAATAEANIIRKGGFSSTFRTTQNGSVAAIVYDSEGRYVNHYVHKKARLDVSGLSEGDYTLITMGYDPVVGQLTSLQAYQDMGLKRDVDYLERSFHVSPGVLTVIEQDEVPVISLEELKTVHPSTTFSVGEHQVTLGDYNSVRLRVKVKNDIAQDSWKYGDFRILFDLPKGCSYLEGSLMVDGQLIDPQYDERGRLKVYDVGIEEGKLVDVRFCLVGKTAGQHTVSACVGYSQYDWQNGDKEFYSPAGAATFTVSPMDYEIVTQTQGRFLATGKAPVGSTISAYVDDILVSQQTLAGKSWGIDTPLPKGYNLSVYPVYIECVTKEGNVYTSPVSYVTVNRDMNAPYRVTMLYPNAYMKKTYTCVWKFAEMDTEVEQYDFDPNSLDFTFLIDFLHNDTTEVKGVELELELSGGKIILLPATFDEGRGCWVTTYKADYRSYSSNMPVGVVVGYDMSGTPFRVDHQQAADVKKDIDELLTQLNKLNELMAGADEDNIDQKTEAYEAEVGYKLVNGTLDRDARNRLSAMTEEEIDEEIARMAADADAQQEEYATFFANVNSTTTQLPYSTMTLEDGTVIHTTDCSAYSEAAMEQQGFDKVEVDDGSSIYMLTDEDHTVMVDFRDGFAMEIVFAKNSDGRLRNPSATIEYAINFMEEQIIGKARDALLKLSREISYYVASYGTQKEIAQMNIQVCEYLLKNGNVTWKQTVNLRRQILRDKLSIVAFDKGLKLCSVLTKYLPKLVPLVNYVLIVKDFTTSLMKYQSLYNSVKWPCKNNPGGALALMSMCDDGATAMLVYIMSKLAIQVVSDISAAGGFVAAVPTGGASAAAGFALKAVAIAASLALDFAFDAGQKEYMRSIEAGIREVNPTCDEEEPEDKPKPHDPGEMPPRKPSRMAPYTPHKVPLIDPSGFVCEAVESNRLEGVTATCFYKKQVEDMYGDKHEEVTVWEAENYGQVNPQLTDRQGMYSWMVPAGQWQVLYEKDGYETQRSAWLPVPPPQLDVNVGMVRRAQPALSGGHAYEKAIDVSFSLYMKSNYITPQTLTFWQDGQQLQGELKATNGETAFGNSVASVDTEDSNVPQYATTFRFVPKKQLAVGSRVTVRALGLCRSYADVPMGADQELRLTVGREVTSIGSEGTIVVPYGGTHQVVISALSAQAAAHRPVTITSLSPDIAQLETGRVTLDAEGKAYITVIGRLPGTTYLSFAVEGSQVKGMDTVRVVSSVDFVEAPKASIISGMYVSEGTRVELTAQQGCTIWYTLDGSCPCDEAKRQRYTGPITITSDTKLRAMATDAQGRESEVVTFTWFISTGIAAPLPPAPKPSSVIYDLQGRKVDKPDNGIYIIDGQKRVRP